MNQGLLHHPFLVCTWLSSKQWRAPRSFYRDTRRRALEHSKLLTAGLAVIQDRNLTFASFYGYACTIACSIHMLYLHHSDPQMAAEAREAVDLSIKFLRQGSSVWSHYARMVRLPFISTLKYRLADELTE